MPNRIVAVLAGLVLAIPAVAYAQGMTMTLTPRLVFSPLAAPPDADGAAVEAQAFKDLIPHLAASPNAAAGAIYLVRRDRGTHPGRYATIWAAPAGTGPSPLTGPGVDDYQLIGADALGPLPAVEVLGVHYIKVRADRREAFERFVAAKLHPAVGNLRPDLRLLYYRCASGPDAGSYITMFALTNAGRNKYWPKGADSDAVKAAFSPSVRALTPELESYLVAGTWGTGMAAATFEAKEWGDWTLVPPPER